MNRNKLEIKKQREIETTLNFFKENGFAKIIDLDHSFSIDAMLYYCGLGNGRYLVANHFNRKKKIDLQGFDLWSCQYNGNKEPGRGEPDNIVSIKLGFKLPDDMNIFEKELIQ